MNRARFAAFVSSNVGAISLAPARARAAQFTYKVAHAGPLDDPRHVRLVQMAHAVKIETNGRMEINVYPNSILGSQTSMMAQIRLGSIEFFCGDILYFASVLPIAAIASIGFAFKDSRQGWEALDGSLGAYLRQEFALKGLHVFEKGFENGMRQTTSSTKPIRNVDDFTGFKTEDATGTRVCRSFQDAGCITRSARRQCDVFIAPDAYRRWSRVSFGDGRAV